ncbi:MAG: HU family DNA-binding protein [Desulfurivibrionaceae bacterium]|nr:HU family DNA-binding protein [Desulfurivibrionaceae bacterium]
MVTRGEKRMNKSELVDNMASAAGISKAAAEKALTGLLDSITNALASDDKVTLVGFGTFSTSKRAARQGRNPQTGDTIQIDARTVARFKPGSKLADAVK